MACSRNDSAVKCGGQPGVRDLVTSRALKSVSTTEVQVSVLDCKRLSSTYLLSLALPRCEVGCRFDNRGQSKQQSASELEPGCSKVCCRRTFPRFATKLFQTDPSPRRFGVLCLCVGAISSRRTCTSTVRHFALAPALTITLTAVSMRLVRVVDTAVAVLLFLSAALPPVVRCDPQAMMAMVSELVLYATASATR